MENDVGSRLVSDPRAPDYVGLFGGSFGDFEFRV